MNRSRGGIGLGDARLARAPPSYNVVLMFIFHSVLQVLISFSKGVCNSSNSSEDGNLTITHVFLLPVRHLVRNDRQLVPGDSVPIDPSNPCPRSRLLVIPITCPGATICPTWRV